LLGYRGINSSVRRKGFLAVTKLIWSWEQRWVLESALEMSLEGIAAGSYSNMTTFPKGIFPDRNYWRLGRMFPARQTIVWQGVGGHPEHRTQCPRLRGRWCQELPL